MQNVKVRALIDDKRLPMGRDRKTFRNGGILIQLCFSSLNQMTLSLSTVQSTLTYGFYP